MRIKWENVYRVVRPDIVHRKHTKKWKLLLFYNYCNLCHCHTTIIFTAYLLEAASEVLIDIKSLSADFLSCYSNFKISLFCTMWELRKKAAFYKPERGLSPGSQSASTLVMYFIGSRTLRNRRLLVKPKIKTEKGNQIYFCFSTSLFGLTHLTLSLG